MSVDHGVLQDTSRRVKDYEVAMERRSEMLISNLG
jgi:hypothetical protein